MLCALMVARCGVAMDAGREIGNYELAHPKKRAVRRTRSETRDSRSMLWGKFGETQRRNLPRSPPIHAAIPSSEAGQNLVADGGRLVGEVVDVDVIAEQSNEIAAAHRFLGQRADVDPG